MNKLRWKHKRKKYAAQKPQKVWNRYRGIINALHAEGRTYNQIREILIDEHGFETSIGQLRLQLRKILLQAPPRNAAAISSSSPISPSQRPEGKSRHKLIVPQQVPGTTDSSIPSASTSSPSHHVPDPPVCHLDTSRVRLSTTGAPLSESVEDVIRKYTTLLDEGIADINPDEVSPVVTDAGSESDQQQASQTKSSAPELLDTITIRYKPIPQTSTDTLQTISIPDSSHAEMEIDPTNDFPNNIGSIMPEGWSGSIESKEVDEFQAELWAQIRNRRAVNAKATYATATSGKTRALRPARVRTRLGASERRQ
jgi:hypothetical protein